MKKYDLSILIPSRSEEFISNTVADILKNKRGKTEVIVGLDGEWAEPQIRDHPDVRIVYVSESRGQRGMTNTLAKLSRAKYVAKCDAHCAFDEGFDVKLMDAVKGHDDWTIVPAMKNLHAFNWVCSNCGTEFYQGEKPDKCPDEMCQFTETKWTKKIYFIPRDMSKFKNNRGPTSTAYRFTPDELQFKYFDALKAYQKEEVAETMSLQGSFFMLTRKKYWELNICDESWGGWGQQGTEVALKTWLSGGRVLCHRGTWYAHMFRTNDQVAFPWNHGIKMSQGRQQHQARAICRDLFKNNKWDKQTRPLSWLVERFWEPLQKETYKPDDGDRPWTKEDLDQVKATEGRFRGEKPITKGIIYFTDNYLPDPLFTKVQKNLLNISKKTGIPIVSCSLKPLPNMGKNIHHKGERGYLTMFKQILKALEASDADVIFMAEHDVLYPKEHFEFNPLKKDVFYYDVNWWKLRQKDGFAIHWDADQVSGLCAYRDELIKYYKYRIETFDKKKFDRKFEPYSGEKSEQWKASRPHIDIRHDRNLTFNKWKLEHFRKKETAVNLEFATYETIPGWKKEQLQDIIKL